MVTRRIVLTKIFWHLWDTMAIALLGASGITVLDKLALYPLFNTEDWSAEEGSLYSAILTG